MSRTQFLLAVPSLLWAVTACSKSNRDEPLLAASSVSPDRLAPEEPLIGSQYVWNVRVPDGMTIASQYPRKVHLTGSRPLTAVMEALREQLVTSHVEVTPQRAVFERAYAKGDNSRRLLRVEVLTEGVFTRVYFSDITPEPAPSGLSERELWERAGYNPDGTVKNPSQVL